MHTLALMRVVMDLGEGGGWCSAAFGPIYDNSTTHSPGTDFVFLCIVCDSHRLVQFWHKKLTKYPEFVRAEQDSSELKCLLSFS
jgi:hypothetical protein